MGGTDGWKALSEGISVTVGSFDLTTVPAVPMDSSMKRLLGIVAADLEEND